MQARLFFALWPDTALRASLHQHALSLKQQCGGRATGAGKLHMTLAFLGDVARARLPELVALARDCGGDAFELFLDKTGCWPRQHIVWMAPQQVPAALARLVAALEAALRSHDFRLEDRAWRPHVTLLRDAQAPREAAQPALQWTVRDFVLVESLRGEYRLLDRWPLGGVPPG